MPEPKIFFKDTNIQVFLTTMCGRKVLDEKTCRCAGLWGEPIHGFVTEPPPAHSHCYGSEWFEEKLQNGATLVLRDKLFLKSCADLAFSQRVHPQRLRHLEEEAKPRPRVIIKYMPPRKSTAQPPPPPSSPTHGSLPVPPSPREAVLPQQEPAKKKRAKAVAKTATPSRKRSPTARIADRTNCSANAVAIGADFERTQQHTEMLRSLIHVFEPAFFEDDCEPIEIDEYEYVKLHRDSADDRLVDEASGAKSS